MIKFVYETPEIHKEFTGVKSIVMEVQDEASRDEMLEAYESFLRAIGYSFDGRIDVVEEDV
jgi:hypothetical protein